AEPLDSSSGLPGRLYRPSAAGVTGILAHVQVEHADLVDPQVDVGLQPRGRVVPRGRDELAAGGQFLAPTGELPLDLRPPGGARSSGTVIFAMRARHSARGPQRTGASARRTRAVTLLRQPDIVGREDAGGWFGPASAGLRWCGRRVGPGSRLGLRIG